MGVALNLKQLAVTYATSRGPLPAMGPVDLDLRPGEFVALLGPSGCGKSTLLKAVAGLFPPSAGDILIDGQGARTRGDVGMVFQQPTLLPWKTVLDNVMVPARILKQTPADAEKRALALLEMVGLSAFTRHYPHELSGGMQQRVAIARGLISDPGIVLLDEPFAALDALTREQVMIDLQQIWETTNKTVLLVTHSIQEAVFMADRVVVLSPRPARIEHIETIALPRPRGIQTMSDPMLVEHCDRLRRLLGGHHATPA